MNARHAALSVVIVVLLAANVPSVFALEGQVVLDTAPSATLAPTAGPGSPLVQAEATRITTQFALSGQAVPVDGLTVSATAWALLDTLPDYNPLDTPGARLALSSRLLQADLAWQIIPGVLAWDTGKVVIHPSSGFFRTPLDLMLRGAAGNVPRQIPAAAPQWEEGWIGTRILLIAGDVSLENFFSPRLVWSSPADAVLGFLSARQPDYMDQLRVQAHIGGADLQALALVFTSGPGSADPSVHAQAGAGIDANLGDRVIVRGEASIADSLERLAVVDPLALAASTQSVPWVVRALAGFTWSISTTTSLVVEYAYNGLGFAGADYASVIQYARNRLVTRASAADVAGQFGAFEAAQHYAFGRLAENITDQLTAQGWVEINLQDPSALEGIGLTMTNDKWSLAGSVTGTWGGSATEAGVSPLVWQLDIECALFF